MGLFGSKTAPLQPTSSGSELSIQRIPDIFYGGNNPVIYESSQEKNSSVVNSKSSAQSKVPLSQTGNSVEKKSRALWLIVALGIVVITAASAYYFYQYQTTRNTKTATPSNSGSKITSTTSTSAISPVITTSTTTVDQAPTTTPSLSSNFLEFPPVNLGTTADTDLDQLTDIEEVLYGIDSGTWDSDQDGYFDGQEVSNLFNPRGLAPMKLIDSGLVREYINDFSGYRLYYPLQWNQGGVDPEEKHMLFSAISGEYIEVRVFQKTANMSFAQWFQTNAPGEQFDLLSAFTNRFGVEGWKRTDGLVVYFDTPSFVFTIIYQQIDPTAPIPYRTSMELVYQSFRPTATSRTIPEQIPLVVPGASSTVSTTP
ncbi:MAG TPA: hypothetical protein PK295_05030 [Candidatus Magasanikbacteria bacterium]|nr:hypothetical protein [Candidatus Magasanikbacteria bacterium]